MRETQTRTSAIKQTAKLAATNINEKKKELKRRKNQIIIKQRTDKFRNKLTNKKDNKRNKNLRITRNEISVSLFFFRLFVFAHFASFRVVGWKEKRKVKHEEKIE